VNFLHTSDVFFFLCSNIFFGNIFPTTRSIFIYLYDKTSFAPKWNHNNCKKVKVKSSPWNRPRKPRSRGTRREWVFNATLRPLYPWECFGTYCIGGWVGPRASLDGRGKSRLYRGSIPGPPRL
jgi:hypothetical protein